MLNKIIVEHGLKKRIGEIFNVSHVTVRKALNGESSNFLAIKIRKAAIENGGKEYKKTEIEK